MLFEDRNGMKPDAVETAAYDQAKVQVKTPGGRVELVGLQTNDAILSLKHLRTMSYEPFVVLCHVCAANS